MRNSILGVGGLRRGQMLNGDTVFVLSEGAKPYEYPVALASLAAPSMRCVARVLMRGVYEATINRKKHLQGGRQ